MQDNTTPDPAPDGYVEQARERLAAAMGLPVEAVTPTPGSNPHEAAAAEGTRLMGELAARGLGPDADSRSAPSPVPVCGACGRERTLADDYDYTPMQLVTGRQLGWFNGAREQMCGECLTAMMSGAWPKNCPPGRDQP